MVGEVPTIGNVARMVAVQTAPGFLVQLPTTPPVAVQILPIGTLLQGNLAGQQQRGGQTVYLAATPQGDVEFQSPLPLDPGSKLVFKVEQMANQLQLRLISVNNKLVSAPPQQPQSAPTASQAPASGLDTPDVIITQGKPGQANSAAYTRPANAPQVPLPAQQTQQAPVVRAVITSPATTVANQLLASPSQPLQMLAQVLMPGQSLWVRLTPTASPHTPGAPNATPAQAHSTNLPPAGTGGAPSTAPTAAAPPSPGNPAQQAAPSPAGSILPNAPTANASAPQAATPAMAAPAGSTPTTPAANQSALATPAPPNALQSAVPSPTSTAPGVFLEAQISADPAMPGLLQAKTPIGILHFTPPPGNPPPTGETILLQLLPDDAPEAVQARTLEAPAETKIADRLARATPQLSEAVRTLPAQDPAAATMLTQSLPQTGKKLTAGSMFLLSAVASSSMKKWLSEETLSKLEEALKPEGLRRLAQEFTGWGQQPATDRSGAPWQAYTLPFYDGGKLQPAMLYVKDDGSEDNTDSKTGGGKAGTRFVVELHLDMLGTMQFDGFFKMEGAVRRFDLVIRSHQPLPEDVRNGLYTLYADIAPAAGLQGGLQFQLARPFPVEFEVQASGPPNEVVI